MVVLLLSALTSLATNVLSIAEVSRFTKEDETFVVAGTVIGRVDSGDYWNLILKDHSGRIILRQSVKDVKWTASAPATGEIIRCYGFAHTAKQGKYSWFVTQIERLGSEPIPDVPVVTAAELLESAARNRTVRLRGIVRDAFFDELDPNYVQLSIRSGGRSVFATALARGANTDILRRLLGRDIEVYGVEMHIAGTQTSKLRHYIHANSLADIQVFNAQEDIPPLTEDISDLSPKEIADLGLRRLEGRVLAAWTPGNVLLRTRAGKISRLELLDGPLPHAGDLVTAIGLPVTDLYNVNLSRATISSLNSNTSSTPVCDTPTSLSADAVLKDELGRNKVKLNLYGSRLTLVGKVRHLRFPSDAGLYLESGSRLVLVDASATPSLLDGTEPDSTISVTGVCVMNIDNWRPDASFPQIRDFMIVPTQSTDLRVLKSPSWFTPQRSIILTSMLSLVIGLLVFINRFAKKMAGLKYAERTRLAIELHDSIAQSLSGISMQVDAATDLATEDGSLTRKMLTVASRSLDSCREELRNCLWDLRNSALEEKDFSEAIRKTIKPLAAETRVGIRFTLPRNSFSDTSRNAVLCIIRELVSNAIRHGGARTIRIAGCVDETAIVFSVRDNGCGFNPDLAPGAGEGHFGLQGIRERIKRIGGSITFKSHLGKGTIVRVKYG